MEPTWLTNLIKALEYEELLIGNLITIGVEKTALLTKNRALDLPAITAKETALIEQMNQLEKVRMQLNAKAAEQLAISGPSPTISTLCDRLDPQAAAKLSTMRDRLRAAMQELQQRNSINAELLQQSIDYVCSPVCVRQYMLANTCSPVYLCLCVFASFCSPMRVHPNPDVFTTLCAEPAGLWYGLILYIGIKQERDYRFLPETPLYLLFFTLFFIEQQGIGYQKLNPLRRQESNQFIGDIFSRNIVGSGFNGTAQCCDLILTDIRHTAQRVHNRREIFGLAGNGQFVLFGRHFLRAIGTVDLGFAVVNRRNTRHVTNNSHDHPSIPVVLR